MDDASNVFFRTGNVSPDFCSQFCKYMCYIIVRQRDACTILSNIVKMLTLKESKNDQLFHNQFKSSELSA